MKKNRLWDFAIYIAIGLALVAAIIWSAYQPHASGGKNGFKLIAAIATALLVTGACIGRNRKLIRVPLFWGFLVAMLIGHAILITALWNPRIEIHGMWWGIIFTGELTMTEYLIFRFVPPPKRR